MVVDLDGDLMGFNGGLMGFTGNLFEPFYNIIFLSQSLNVIDISGYVLL